MPQIATLCLGVVSTTVAAVLSEQCTSKKLTYLKVFALGLGFFLPLYFIWAFILQPVYFSSLLEIPSAPRLPGLTVFFRPLTPEEILDTIDTVLNDGYIRFLDVFNTEIIVLTQPKMIADFSGPKAYHFVKAPGMRRFLEGVLGKGLVTSEGAEHKHQRKHLLAAFNTKVVRGLYPLFWERALDMVSLVKDEITRKDGKSRSAKIDVEEWAGRVSLDIIGQAGFGSDFSSLHNPNTPLNTAYRTAFIPSPGSQWVFLFTLLTSPTFVGFFPIKRVTEIANGVIAVTEFIKTLVEERKRQMYMNVDNAEYVEKITESDIMSVAMCSGVFDIEGLVAQSKTMLAAGHKTSAGALAWALHLLSQPKHAHIQEKLRQEIRAHLPSPSSGIPIDANTIECLPYLDAVSKEAMRVCPALPDISRISAIDTDICGLRIPKGTHVRAPPWAINKAKHLWGDDAREFKPERWLTGEKAVTGGAEENLAYMTFGHGPRVCIGRGFAIAENKALLSALIGSLDFKAAPGSPENPKIIFTITSRIVGGPQVTASIVDGW